MILALAVTGTDPLWIAGLSALLLVFGGKLIHLVTRAPADHCRDPELKTPSGPRNPRAGQHTEDPAGRPWCARQMRSAPQGSLSRLVQAAVRSSSARPEVSGAIRMG